jgi:hypothetical protein
VEVEFDFAIRGLPFGETRVDEPITKTAYIVVKDPGTQITEITSSSPYLEYKQLPLEPGQGNTENRIPIEVTLLPGAGIGNFRETITAVSNLEENTQAILRVSARIKGDIELNPQALRFDKFPIEGEETSKFQKLQVTNLSSDRDLQILSVEDPEHLIDVELKTLQGGQRYEIDGTLNEDNFGDQKYHRGALVITTNHPVYDTVKVEYNIYSR